MINSGKDYSVPFGRVKVKINRFKRYDDISGTDIKKLIYEKDFKKVKSLVPKEVFKTIKERF